MEAARLLPKSLVAGKVYEVFALALVAERLAVDERLSLRLVNGNAIALKSSPGPINRNYPYIELWQGGILVGEVWTDVEFTALSYSIESGSSAPDKGQYHELDIVVVQPGVSGRPSPDQVMLGVECKNTGYAKRMLREIVGVRRELSLLTRPAPTSFKNWPRCNVPAHPPSCLVVISSDPRMMDFAAPGRVFGIDFIYEPVP
jgi:hypothetical protein